MSPPDEVACLRILSDAFRMPSFQTMVSRKPSITNAFVNAVTPVKIPSPQEIEKALSILGMDPSDVRCAYCGDRMTEWDHLRPLVHKKRPTGFITEIANLVPACGKCNQSKGNKPWREWIQGKTAKHSPTKRGIEDVASRIARLEEFERVLTPTKIDFEAIVGVNDWSNYWKLWDAVMVELEKCQEVATALRQRVADAINHQASSP